MSDRGKRQGASGQGASGQGAYRCFYWVGVLTAILLVVLSLAPPAAHAISLPGRRPPSPTAPTLTTGRSSQQEVAPPLGVQQLQEALEGRRPRLEILAPADGALLEEGPWTLQLQVEDWPLVDAGPLGLGPHVVVQLDGDPPLPLTSTTATMRPLEPGSHRLTVYAARPWGEVVKSPSAQRQIRLHRVATNPLSQPAPGSPQLIAVSPRGTAASTPLLLDWLLLDAPLQNLRSGDASWRLRVSINGDSFLVDRQTPLWLEGWRTGSNAIQLDLLDGLGEPLNPPFNSLVEEVILQPGGESPPWQGGRLDPSTLASLLGEAPSPSAPEPGAEPDPDPDPEPEPVAAPEAEDGVPTGATAGTDSEAEIPAQAEMADQQERAVAATPDLPTPPEPDIAPEAQEPLDGSLEP